MGRRAWGTGALAIDFGVMATAIAAAHLGRGADADVWEDALFFRRVACTTVSPVGTARTARCS